MKVIHIRGTNGSGKTTAVRQFISKNHFVVKSIKVSGRDIEYHWDDERKVAIIGRYDKRVSGGVDGYIVNKELLKNTIMRIIKDIQPEALIFEGVMYGHTFKFSFEVARAMKRLGVDYIGLTLQPQLETCLDRVQERNGGKEVDDMKIQDKWFRARISHEKLKAAGIPVKMVNTTAIPKDQMNRIIEDEI